MKIKFGAYSIENLVPEFDEAYGGKFFSPHVLSYGLAALLCPISFDAILYGFSHPNVQLSAQVLKSFGFSRGIVVTSSLDGIHYIDEFSVIGKSYYIDFGKKLKKDMIKMLDPLKDYNLPEYKIQQIEKEPSKQEQLRVVTKILMGKEIGPKAELICLNAGAILYLSELVENIEEGFSIAKKMLPKGEAFELLRKFIELTGGKQKI